ncbi:MAG TPA: hypothetical protein VGA99_05915 [bacterium]
MSKKIFIIAFLVLVVGLSLGLARTPSPAYQEVTTKSQTATLTPLVGQRCTMVLLSGDELTGTLWEVGEDYVTIKLRKGLLYSKADKYAISEISYIADEAGRKYVVSGTTSSQNDWSMVKSNTALATRPGESASKGQAADTVTGRTATPRYFDGELLATPDTDSGKTHTAKAEDKSLRILTYQIKILFGVALFAIGLIIFLKLIGMKGSAYGKHSLFPARVVRMNGQYGIIDQGGNDGVKKDDIIRLYRRRGRKIQFKAKVKVIKVENSYSAVELVKGSRRIRPEVGDVGFRDRNLLATGFKVFRIITSALLGLMAKFLEFVAKNIKVNNETPVIKINMFDNELKVEKVRSDVKVKSKSSAKPKMTETEA